MVRVFFIQGIQSLENVTLHVKVVQFEYSVNETQEIYREFLRVLHLYCQELPLVLLFSMDEHNEGRRGLPKSYKDTIQDILTLWTQGSGVNEVIYGHLGKPSLKTLSFNYSTSDNWIGFIVASPHHSVGVDIEAKDKVARTYSLNRAHRLQAIIDNFYTTAEKKYMEKIEIEGGFEAWRNTFFTTWTMKESLVKALGESIGSHSQLLDITHGTDPYHKLIYQNKAWYTQGFSQKSLFGSISMDSQFDLQYIYL